VEFVQKLFKKLTPLFPIGSELSVKYTPHDVKKLLPQRLSAAQHHFISIYFVVKNSSMFYLKNHRKGRNRERMKK